MDDENKIINSISYRPNIKPTKDYYSDIEFKTLSRDDEIDKHLRDEDEIVSPNFVNEDIILDDLDRVLGLLEFLPNSMQGNLSEILDGMKQIIENNPIDYTEINKPEYELIERPDIEEPILPTTPPTGDLDIPPEGADKEEDKEKEDISKLPDKNEYEDTEEQSDNYRDDYDFQLEDNQPIVNIKIETTDPDKNKYLNEHNLHIAQIFNKYVKNMNTIMSNYFTKIISTLDLSSGKGLKYLLREYVVPTKELNNKNLQHLSDTIIKNQIINKQDIMLFNKLYNKKEFQKHLRFCKVATLSRDRYHNLEYENVNSNEGIIIDSLLSKERIVSDIKYKESFKSLYKFLNSQIETMEDILDNTIEVLLSKSILIKEEREGVELATNTEMFVSRYANSLEREIKRREEREAQLAQRQKEREEKEKSRTM